MYLAAYDHDVLFWPMWVLRPSAWIRSQLTMHPTVNSGTTLYNVWTPPRVR